MGPLKDGLSPDRELLFAVATTVVAKAFAAPGDDLLMAATVRADWMAAPPLLFQVETGGFLVGEPLEEVQEADGGTAGHELGV